MRTAITGGRAACSRYALFLIALLIVASTNCGLDAIRSVNVRRGGEGLTLSTPLPPVRFKVTLSPLLPEVLELTLSTPLLTSSVRTDNDISCGIANEASIATSLGACLVRIIARSCVENLIALTFQCLVVKVLQSVRCISDRRFRRRY
jgi:hypothetical protein